MQASSARRFLHSPFLSPLRRLWSQRCRSPLRYFTGPVRLLPDFMIIGAQKAGTSSLYCSLCRHPAVHAACQKEVHFFDLNYPSGERWYRSYFPLTAHRWLVRRLLRGSFITGEASPYYLFEPRVPKRASQLLPHVKLIVLLRNPVDRAYSHYHHEIRAGRETLSFEEALDAEESRLVGERERLLSEETYVSPKLRTYSYLSRGLYAAQLRPWFDLFDRRQIFVIKSEDMFESAGRVLGQVWEFLELPAWNPEDRVRVGAPNRYAPMAPAIRARLGSHFEPHNQELYDLLDNDFNW